MINAYEVGAVLKLTDLITPALVKITEGLDKVQAKILKINTGLEEMKTLGRGLGVVKTELAGIGREAQLLNERLGRSASSALKLDERLRGLSARPMERAATATATLSGELARATARAATLKSTMGGIGAAGVAGAAAGGGRRGRHSGLHGGAIHFGRHGLGIGTMGMAAGDLMPVVIGGAVLGYGAHSVLHSAGEYQGAVNRFTGLGLGAATNADAVRFANSQNLNGVNSIDIMTQLRDLHTAMGNYEHAKLLAPSFARQQFANRAVYGEGAHGMTEQQMADLGRVIDMRGAWKSPAEMRRHQDLMQRVVSGTGGMVLPSQYRLMLGTGGIAAKNLSDYAFFYEMEPIIQEMRSGSKVGSGLTAANNNLGQGKTTKRAAQILASMGLISSHDFVKGSGFKAGTLKGEALRESDPVAWTNQVLVPAIKAYLARNHMAVNDANIMNTIGSVMTNTRGATLYSYFYQQRDKIARAAGVDQRSMGLNQIEGMADKSYAGQVQALGKEWTEFKKELGLIIMPSAIKFLHGLTDGLKDAAHWMHENQTATKILVGSLASLAGAVGFGLTVRVLAKAFGGLSMALGFSSAGGAAGIAKKAWSLRALSGALSLLTSPVGALVAILAGAGYAGYKAVQAYGEWKKDSAATEAGAAARHSHRQDINRQLIALHQKPLGPYDDTMAGEKRLAAARAAAQQAHGGVIGNVYLNHQKVGQVLQKSMAHQAATAGHGYSGHDGTMSIPHSGH